MKKKTKLTATQLRLHRTVRAFETAGEILLCGHLLQRAIEIKVLPPKDATSTNLNDYYCYEKHYDWINLREVLAGAIGFIAAPEIMNYGEVNAQHVYDTMMSLPDPRNLMDKFTVDEVEEAISAGIQYLIKNRWELETTVARLLKMPTTGHVTITFAPMTTA